MVQHKKHTRKHYQYPSPLSADYVMLTSLAVDLLRASVEIHCARMCGASSSGNEMMAYSSFSGGMRATGAGMRCLMEAA